MSRLIDADELISKLVYDVRLDSAFLDENDISELRRKLIQFDKDCKMSAIEFVREEQTVDAVPVKRGQWLKGDDETVSGKCSVCGWEANYYETDVCGMPYCPNCGARMDKQ